LAPLPPHVHSRHSVRRQRRRQRSCVTAHRRPANSPPSTAATYCRESTPFAHSLHYNLINYPPHSAPLSGLAAAATADEDNGVGGGDGEYNNQPPPSHEDDNDDDDNHDNHDHDNDDDDEEGDEDDDDDDDDDGGDCNGEGEGDDQYNNQPQRQ